MTKIPLSKQNKLTNGLFLEPLFRTEAPQDQAITVLGTQVKVEVTL